MFSGVSVGVWIAAALVVLLIGGLTLWVTNKAYSKKWDEDE